MDWENAFDDLSDGRKAVSKRDIYGYLFSIMIADESLKTLVDSNPELFEKINNFIAHALWPHSLSV